MDYVQKYLLEKNTHQIKILFYKLQFIFYTPSKNYFALFMLKKITLKKCPVK